MRFRIFDEIVAAIVIQARLCATNNILVVPIPGPSAVVAALSASGLSTSEFTFGIILTKLITVYYGSMVLLLSFSDFWF